MRDLNLRALGIRLLRGGVAPKHVQRTITELRHHIEDLKQGAGAGGMSPEEATTQAHERIGNLEQIIEATLARPELKSWAYRWPWAAYGLLPVFALALALVGSILLGIGALTLAQSFSGLDDAAFGQALASRPWLQSLSSIWIVATAYILPIGVAGLICLMAAKRDAPIIWPAVGVFLTLFLGFCFNLSFTPPQVPGGQAQLSAGIGFGTDQLLQARTLRLLLPLLFVLLPYYAWRRWQSNLLRAELH